MSVLYAEDELISVEDYLAGELSSQTKHEYIDGKVYAMGGASSRHGLIANALAFALTPNARKKGCQLFVADMKVHLEISNQPVFYYPDLVLACDPTDRDTYIRNRPCLIIEILSPSTERVDRREKRWSYQTLPSLREYVLVAQDRPQIEIYRRSNQWQPEIFNSGELHLECLEMNLSVHEVYQDIEFPPFRLFYPTILENNADYMPSPLTHTQQP
ncbi:MAG: Uma2 family endonuclease [Halothiobacillaceae bacterium]